MSDSKVEVKKLHHDIISHTLAAYIEDIFSMFGQNKKIEDNEWEVIYDLKTEVLEICKILGLGMMFERTCKHCQETYIFKEGDPTGFKNKCCKNCYFKYDKGEMLFNKDIGFYYIDDEEYDCFPPSFAISSIVNTFKDIDVNM